MTLFQTFFSDYEGKAGMASIILKPNKSLDLEKVYEQVVTYLPAYACPRFLRIQVISCLNFKNSENFIYPSNLRPGIQEMV